MKVKALASLMNDHGTNPRVMVFKSAGDARILVYEGKPQNIDEESGNLKVNSFTVCGVGFIEINAQ